MLTSPLLLLPILSLLSATTSAKTVFTGAAYTIPTLTLWNSTTGNFTMSFFVHDPEPVATISTSCGATWDKATSFPSQWTSCRANSMDWKFSAFTSIEEFELQVKHSFRDSSVGQPPQDMATTFAEAIFTAPENLTCTDNYCTLNVDEIAELPIWAAIA